MRFSLGAKILASFALIVLLSLVIVVSASSRLNSLRFDQYSRFMDMGRARVMARVMSEWTEKAVRGEGQKGGVSTEHPFLSVNPPEMMPMGRSERRPASPGGLMNRMERWMGTEYPGESGTEMLVITDLDGTVLLDTGGFTGDRLHPDGLEGAEIRHNDVLIGYLYLSSMIPGAPRPMDTGYFRPVDRVTWIITGLVFILAMALGILLTVHIVRPVRVLNRATTDVAAGRLDARVPEKRNDELGELSRAFNDMTKSLESADSQRRRLVADSAHELRTPVSLIRMRIEMIEEGVYPMDAESLGALAGETDRLVALVEELRVLADLESPETAPERQTVDAVELVVESISSVMPAAEKKGISIEREVPEDVPELNADVKQVHRLLANLLSNALRHARSRIRVSLSSGPDREAVFLVEDDGPGLPEDEQEKVFRRYYRLDESRSRDSGGSGLGLAICREIAGGHKGEISAGRSGELGGALFRVVIPSA